MKRACLATICLLSVAVAPIYSQEPSDQASIDGPWYLTGSTTPTGKKIPPELVTRLMGKLILATDGAYEQLAAGEKVEVGKYKTDADKKPAWIDLEPASGTNKGKKQLGIFKVEGGKLTIALGKVGSDERPKDFKDARNAEVSTYKRAD
jgi:uncharacterized protein (TIGR03067 family)